MAGKQKNKNRKIDRNRKRGNNGRYIAEHRHEKSHIRRIKAHLERYSKTGHGDQVAKHALQEYKVRAGILE